MAAALLALPALGAAAAAAAPATTGALITAAGGTAVASGFGAAAPLALGASLSSIPTMSLISGGLTAASAFGSIMGGSQEQGTYKAQARQSELAAQAEELKGREQADKIRRSLQSTLASQNAAFASRGISSASGTPVRLGAISSSEAARDIELAQFGGQYGAATERAQSKIYKSSGRSSLTKGFAGAGLSLIKNYG